MLQSRRTVGMSAINFPDAPLEAVVARFFVGHRVQDGPKNRGHSALAIIRRGVKQTLGKKI